MPPAPAPAPAPARPTHLARRAPPPVRKLRPFQAEGVEFIRANDFRCLLADGPGSGKTIQLLCAFSHEKHRVAPALVIAPSSVTENWRRETAKWVPWAKVHVIDDEGTPVPRGPFDVVICSWSLMWNRAKELVGRGFRLVVADECHAALNPEAQRSRALAYVCDRVPHVCLLTGTPVINAAAELGVLGQLLKCERPPMIRRVLEDIAPDVPPKVRKYVPVQLAKKQAQEYAAAESEFRNWLEDIKYAAMDMEDAEDAVAGNMAAEALVKIGYLRRILGQGKVDAAVEWIARAVRAGEPVLAFAEHMDVIDGVERGLRRLRIATARLDGSTSKRDRVAAIDSFQSGRIPVFLGSRAAKEGITLTRARNVVFIERFWTSADEEQSEDRSHRIGQTRPVTVWFLHAEGTVDDRIREILDSKRTIVRNAVGNTDVEEDTVRDLLAVWTRGQVQAPAAQASGAVGALGTTGQNAPALPKRREVHTFLFDTRKWSKREAFEWTRINGYVAISAEATPKCIRVLNRPPTDFCAGTFRRVPLSADIFAVIGRPRSA